jgi:hypothetical protein
MLTTELILSCCENNMTKPGGANEGWNAPRKSMLLGHLNGLATKATNEEVRISFEPAPGYAGIANAAGGGQSMQ